MSPYPGQRGRPRKRPFTPRAESESELLTPVDTEAAPDETDEAVERAAPRARELGKIADRNERAERLTTLLRDDSAKGAEWVAASRMLEAMEARATEDDDQPGAPAPTTRAEQVVRLVRILACAGPDVRAEAIEIVGRRTQRGQEAIQSFLSILAEPVSFPTTSAANGTEILNVPSQPSED